MADIVAACTYTSMFGHNFNFEASWCKVFYTFTLCFVVLSVAVVKVNKERLVSLFGDSATMFKGKEMGGFEGRG